MAIASTMVLMMVLMFFGRRAKEFGLKEFFLVFLVTLAQLAIFVLFMLTYERPVLN